MTPPRPRPRAANGAFFFFPFLASAALVLSLGGCASLRRGGGASPPPSADTGQTLLAPRHVEVGRILSHDASEATVVIEFAPHIRPTPFLAGTRLIARRLDTLEPTAELQAAPYQSGRMLGAYVRSGLPGIDDEVVIPPAAAPVPAEPTPAEPAP
jgi:hypothetical protein